MFSVQFQGKFPQKNRLLALSDKVINHYFDRRLKRNIFIDVVCWYNQLKTDYVYGEMHELCDDHFLIELSRRDEDNSLLKIDDIASTLCHELVHVKQIVKKQYDGENRYRISPKHGWKNYKYRKYKKQPWEVEAFEQEKILMKKFWYNNE